MRTSTYTIFVTAPNCDSHYLVHGYSGAIDRVKSNVVHFLLDHADQVSQSNNHDEILARNAVKGAAPTADATTVALLRSRGYLTDKSAEEERALVTNIAAYAYRRATRQMAPSFVLIPTYECNLRCSYCFESSMRSQLTHIGTIGRIMSSEMASAAFKCIDQLTSEAKDREEALDGPTTQATGGSPPSITLYGGEPLMASTRLIVEYIVELAVQRGRVVRAITNGVELRNFADLLGPERIAFVQITLDGPKDLHNQKRRGPSFRNGTFDTILDNVSFALERGVRVGLRVHVDWLSVMRAGELASALARRGLLDNPLLEIFTCVRNCWREGSTLPVYPEMRVSELHQVLPSSLNEADAKQIGVMDHQLTEQMHDYARYGLPALLRRIVICGAFAARYQFDPFGAVHPCLHYDGTKDWQTGSYSQDGLVLNQKAGAWKDRSPSTMPECIGCKYVFFHRCGCPAMSLVARGNLRSAVCDNYWDDFQIVTHEILRSPEFKELCSNADQKKVLD